jgi:hypothetical protein
MFEMCIAVPLIPKSSDGIVFLLSYCGAQNCNNEKLHNLYSSPSIIRMIMPRRMRWAGHVAQMREKRNAYRILRGKPEENRPLGRPRRMWMENIKMYIREIDRVHTTLSYLAQDRDQWNVLVNTVMNLLVP